jgi:hypothetical protein
VLRAGCLLVLEVVLPKGRGPAATVHTCLHLQVEIRRLMLNRLTHGYRQFPAFHRQSCCTTAWGGQGGSSAAHLSSV